MDAWNLIVAAYDGSRARHVRDRLLAAWTGSPAPVIETAAPDELHAKTLERVDGVVLIVDEAAGRPRVLSQLALFDEIGVAVVTLFEALPTDAGPFAFTHTMLDRIDQDPSVLAAKMHGLLHRQGEIEQLRSEVSVAHRFHGGLRGEISRMHDELQLAAMVQRELLPRTLPQVLGLDFGVLWRPAHYVSGDIYDVAQLDDDHVGVFIADAVGHGVPAALMTMVICRSLVPKLVSGSSYRLLEPAEVLDRLNHDMLRRQGRSTRFATAAYALIDCRRRTMRLAGAGHPPPVVVDANGDTRELETNGGLLGVFESEEYDQIEVELALDDKVLFHSDGFEQAFPLDDADDYERRLPTTRYRTEFIDAAQSEPSPAEMVGAISRRLDDQKGSLHQIDDLTLICVHAGPLVPPGSTSHALQPVHDRLGHVVGLDVDAIARLDRAERRLGDRRGDEGDLERGPVERRDGERDAVHGH